MLSMGQLQSFRDWQVYYPSVERCDFVNLPFCCVGGQGNQESTVDMATLRNALPSSLSSSSTPPPIFRNTNPVSPIVDAESRRHHSALVGSLDTPNLIPPSSISNGPL